jgi:KDO2-lipid IV(A) lauroyltransferase
MTKFRHYIEFGIIQIIRGVLFVLPRSGVRWVGRRMGDLFHNLDKRHRELVISNLDLAYGDELDKEEKQRIARGVYHHFATMLMELIRPRKASMEYLEKISTTEGWENMEKAYAMDRGVLVLTAHFGVWELMGVAHGYKGRPLYVVARVLDNPMLNKLLHKYRTQSGNVVLYKANAVKAILGVLKMGEAAAVLIDQNVNPNRGIFVDFFGVPASTTTVVSALAAKTGAPIVPAFSLPDGEGGWKFIYEKPLVFDDGDKSKERIAEITQKCTDIIESYIRKQPEKWLWLHRRWKTRPPEEEGHDKE